MCLAFYSLFKAVKENDKAHKGRVNALLENIRREAKTADTAYLKHMISKRGFDKLAKRVIQEELARRGGINGN